MDIDFIKQINQFGQQSIPFLLIIDFEIKRPIIYPIFNLPTDILFQTTIYKNSTITTKTTTDFRFKKFPVNFRIYKKAFDKIQDNIRAGNTYLLNLTFPTKIETNLSLKEIFLLSKAKYKLLFNDRFVVFSPETFIRIFGGKIYSYPMKGTIDANIPNAQDVILNDVKETAEHNTIVDLIRNDLSIVSNNVTVEKYRYIDELVTNDKRLLQVSSVISGDLPENYKEILGDIIFSLLPAGSISGAPKKKTVKIIKDTESYERGYYTGIMGYFDGENFDSAVMIRFIEKKNECLIYKSGGGITYLSDPRSEYEELIKKVYVPIN
ncbi:MAG: aminodeoxychorismate synthase component I [Bacteroidales bacterium]|nr:aminodeoxychorismate synthase component I [Bacteroidales bacterium]